MKLYATTTSERASKGQGGNDYLLIEIKDKNKDKLITLHITCARSHLQGEHYNAYLTNHQNIDIATTSDICEKCGEIHDVEKAGGHDLAQAQKVLECECSDYPDDEFCQEVLKGKGKKQKGE